MKDEIASLCNRVLGTPGEANLERYRRRNGCKSSFWGWMFPSPRWQAWMIWYILAPERYRDETGAG